MFRTFQQDYEFGKAQEALCLPDLETFFKTSLNHNQDRMAPFDFENDSLAIEQKSRHCRFATYKDTMLQYTKILNCSLPAYKDKEKWFVFKFEDGLYGIRYDPVVFEKYERKSSKIRDRLNIREKEQLRIYIDTDDLVPIAAC
jgi:hypothetical protein